MPLIIALVDLITSLMIDIKPFRCVALCQVTEAGFYLRKPANCLPDYFN